MTILRITSLSVVFSLLASVGCASPRVQQRAAKEPVRSRTIVFIHGLFMTADCWAGWKANFEQQGYTVLTPTWPVFEGKTAAQIKAQHPDAALGDVSLNGLIDHFAGVVEALPEKPVIIGHSMGGLIAQILMARGLGEAAVAINSAPPAGVFAPSWPLIRNAWPILSPFSDPSEPLYPDFVNFKRSWTHLTPETQARQAYDAGFIPTSLRVAKDSLDEDVAAVDPNAKRGPLLMVTGADDQTIPLNLATANYEAYAAAPSVTDFKVFEGRTHYILEQEGWEEVAAYIAAWLEG